MIDLVKYDIGENLERIMRKYSEHNAVHVQDEIYTYGYLYNQSDAIRKIINNITNEPNQLIGVLCYRSFEAYSGIIGTLFSKNAYLPLNPNNPVDKLKKIINVSECKMIILGEECADVFSGLVDIKRPLILICPKPGEKIKQLQVTNSHHTFIFPDQTSTSDIDVNKIISGNDPAYMMFTSGSTGDPKGIIVSHKNLYSYCIYSIERYQFNGNDRVSQMFDITFDLSVHDIVTTLLSGACLYVLPKNYIMSPGPFIRKHELTIWFSVPSIAMFMGRMKVLQKNSLPSLRYSLFCGEGLPCHTAAQWKSAAPNTIVDNLYGPTEATIAFMDYRWHSDLSDEQCINGLVPIGTPFTGIHVKLIKEGQEVDFGEIGELCVHGDQVVSGYYKNDQLTKEKFISLPDNHDKIWYRTGDLAKNIDSHNYAFLGRVDDQLQVRGNRVEMQEIDKVIRDAAMNQMAISIAILSEDNENIAEDIVAFIEGDNENKSENEILDYCSSVLPDYMVPSKIYFIDSMPMNQNGKIDKKELYSKLSDIDNSISVDNQDDAICCRECLKGLEEDADLNGVGLIRIVSHDGKDDYICHVCLKGF